MSNQFGLQGIDELLGKFASITNDVKYKGGRFALRKAANVVAKAAKQGAERVNDPKTGRSISANIAVRFSNRTFKKSGDLMFRVGVKHGSLLKDGGDVSANAPTPHWRLLEFGTEKMPADPFMRQALESNVSTATGEFIGQYKKSIDRAIKKAQKVTV